MARKSILLVDDEVELRKILRDTILQGFQDVQIIEASNGADAFSKLSNQRFDLAVIDLQMPRMAGKELLESFKALPANRRPEKVLVFSAYGAEAEIQAKFGKGVDYIAKPATVRCLLDYFGKVLSSQASAKPKMDLTIVNAFIDSTLEVLKTMANVEAKKDSLCIRGEDSISGDISAIIAIMSPKQRGSMAIAFEERCFLYLVSALLGEKHDKISSENRDAAAELCNQIFGMTKVRLNEMGWEIQPAIPNVITGPGHQIQHMAAGPCIAVRFVTPNGFFTIETALQMVT